MKNICIYHKSCADGFGAALAVKVYLDRIGEDCEWFPAHYGENAPDVSGKNVYIVDFSYPRDELIAMDKVSDSIIVLDHHKTAESDLDGLDFCQFNMKKSGAMMAWEHFNPTSKIPLLIQHIQDRDLWIFEMHGTKEISSALRLLPFDFDEWVKFLDDSKMKGLYATGEIILAYELAQVNHAVNREWSFKTIANYHVPCINTTTLISEIGHELCTGHPFAAMYFDTDSKRIYSLRSDDAGIDVSEIAKKFGGGGHARAAGFSTELPKHILPEVK